MNPHSQITLVVGPRSMSRDLGNCCGSCAYLEMGENMEHGVKVASCPRDPEEDVKSLD